MIFTYITNKMGGYISLRSKYLETNLKLLRKIYLFIKKGYELETNSYLPFETTIKGPINFPHSTYGVFFSGNAVIGKNCTIYQQVTIGSNMLYGSKQLGSPRIGDNVIIGAGAKIIGNITVGDNCRIGANAVVTKDLAPNYICIANSTQLIRKNDLENRVYQQRNNYWGYMKDGEFVKEEDIEIINSLIEASLVTNI